MAYHNTSLKPRRGVLKLEELHLSKEIRARINQLIEEFTYLQALRKFDIPIDNKILLYGKTGCGKTATAHAIALALNKKVITLNLGGFVSSRLGETGKNISEVFRNASIENAVLFIDEFDFIGKMRDYDDKDSGEMKRLVNTLIQQIDNLSDTSLLICATNHVDVIDTALLRRFQIRLKYELPTDEELDIYYDSLLSHYPKNINKVKRSYKISYAEAKDIVYQQVKANIIQLEKQKKYLIFSYDNTKSELSQLTTQNKKVSPKKEILVNYKLDALDVNDNSAIIATRTKDESDKIEGFVFKVTAEELNQIDKFKAVHYKRVLEKTNTGSEVWVYVAKNSF